MLASLALLLAVTPVAPAAASEDEQLRFTVGIGNEVDSFNPFLGIEAESYEMWALTYDYLVGYSMDDMSPEPSAWPRLGDLRGRTDLDLHDP